MKSSKYIIVLGLLSFSAAVFTPLKAQEAQNNPYADNKLFHMGFQVGASFCSFDTRGAAAGVSAPGFGFRVGFVTDLRICKYLNLRFTPGLEFSYRTLSYADNPTITEPATISSIPFNLPLYLKFSAERLGNFRPYVIAGGGASINWYSSDMPYLKHTLKEYVGQHWLDYFCEVGFGCDIYFSWFKLCPEITYRIGFGDQLDREHKLTGKEVYVEALEPYHLFNQAICITFNFE